MKIAVNLFLASPRSITGAFVYIQDILPALFKADSRNTYYLLGGLETVKYFESLYGDLPNVKFRIFDIRRDVFVNPIRAIRKFIAKRKNDYQTRENIIAGEVRAYLEKESIELYFSPSQTIFPRDLGDIRTATIILDLQFDYFPENFSADYLKKRRRDARYAVERSDCLIAISEYTKKTLEEKYDAPLEKMSVIYWAPQELKEEPATLNLPTDFVFFPAAIWPHKNHRVLIQALGILKDRFPSLHCVCTGAIKSKVLKNELEEMTESEGVGGRVLFTGFVSDGDIRFIYTHAKALVFPSSFEGFGIPLVEAMHFGLPVIAADNSSITEVVDGAGVLVKTGDADALAEAIEKVLTDTNLRNELIKKGRERAKLFSWEKTAAETLEVFHSVNSR